MERLQFRSIYTCRYLLFCMHRAAIAHSERAFLLTTRVNRSAAAPLQALGSQKVRKKAPHKHAKKAARKR